MASLISSSTSFLLATSNITTTSSKTNSVAASTNNVLQQLQQLQRITQQISMASSKTSTLSANTKLMNSSSISQKISSTKSLAATTNNVQQQLQQLQHITQEIPITLAIQKSSTISSSATSNIFSTSSAIKSAQQPPKQQEPKLTYILYLHLEEVRRRKSPIVNKAKTKYQLTHELISKTMRTIHKLSPDDLEIISQQTIYKTNLRREIANEKHKKYMEINQKQHKTNFPKKQQQKQFLPQQYRYHQAHGIVGTTPMEDIPSSGYFSRRT